MNWWRWPSRLELRFAAQLVSVAMLLASLTQLVDQAAGFSHDLSFFRLLGEQAAAWWGWLGFWLLSLAARVAVTPDETRLWLMEPRWFGWTVAGLLAVLVTPFTNAYFTHVTHPTLAVALVWVLWPVVTRLVTIAIGAREPVVAMGLGGHPWLAASAVFALVFLQSYRRHLWFGSGGKDLGLFHQTVWLLSRGESPENTVMGMHAFADHLELIDLLAVPLQWLWPSAAALLLFQALLVGLAAVPVFDLARRTLGSVLAGWAMVATFALGFDLQQAVMFDWNPTTCGAVLLPWVVWCFERERLWGFAFSLALVALAKENLVLYALGLCLTLAVRPQRRRWALAAAAVLAVFFVLELEVIFPMFRPAGFRHWRFAELGEGPLTLVGEVLRHPYRAFVLLFTPGNKIDGLLVPFSTVAFACWLAPRWGLAFAPIILERFWSSHGNRWWGHHYGAGIGVLATLAAIEGLGRARTFLVVRQRSDLLPAAVAAVLLSCVLVGTLGRFGPGPLWVWRQPYYTTATDRADAEAVLGTIPAEATVAAQNHLLPHLSGRRGIFQLVRGEGAGPPALHADFVEQVAEYVAFDLQQSAWPREPQFAAVLARELLQRGYGVSACQGAAVVLRRGAVNQPCPALGL